MNAEFEKYWKSSRASDRPFAETNAQILDKMIAKTHFLAGAAAMLENLRAEVVNEMQLYAARDITAAIRKIEVE